MRIARYFLIAAALLAPASAFAAATEAYNPCDHLADLYQQKSAVEYQGIVKSCASNASQTPVEQGAEQAKHVAEVAKGVGVGVGDAAKGIGEAISDLAKNLGVTVNDFIKSPAGMLLAGVLVIKLIGMKILAIPFVIFVLMFWWFVNNRMSRDVEYEFVPVLWGAFKIKRVAKCTRHFDDAEQIFAMLTGIGGGILCLIVVIAL